MTKSCRYCGKQFETRSPKFDWVEFCCPDHREKWWTESGHRDEVLKETARICKEIHTAELKAELKEEKIAREANDFIQTDILLFSERIQ